MAQKRGLKKEETGAQGAGATPNPPKVGRPVGSRKTAYAIDLSSRMEAIDKIAELYDVKASAVIAELATLYLSNAFAPHFSKVQGQYAADRRQREEDALREIAALASPVAQATSDMMEEPAYESPEVAG